MSDVQIDWPLIDLAVRVAAPLCLEATRNPKLIERARELRALPPITNKASVEAARVRTNAAAAAVAAAAAAADDAACAAACADADAAVAAAVTAAAAAGGYWADGYWGVRRAHAWAMRTIGMAIAVLSPRAVINTLRVADAEIAADPRWWDGREALGEMVAGVLAEKRAEAPKPKRTQRRA